jgi:subtilase family serine protease
MTPKKLLTIQITALFALLSIPALQASAQNTFVPSRITQAVDESQLTVLKHNTYPLARAEFDRGPAPASLPMENMQLVLKRSLEQEAALDKLMAEQLDNSSPNFHKWLTPVQFGQQFGPSDQDVQTITSWLGSHGFQVVDVSNGRTVINFSGNAGQVQQAFHTAIHSYVVNGEQHWANSSDPQIPTALTPVIAGVNTLHNFRWRPANVHVGEFNKSKETGKVTAVNPTFTFAGGCGAPEANCFGVGPGDFATIYNVLPRYAANNDGSGVIIAVVGQTDINPLDYSDFRSLFGLPPGTLNILPTTFPAGGCSSDPGTTATDEPEADIDTQWSGGVAKGATIDYVRCASTNAGNGVDLSATYIVNTLDVNRTIAVMSESYGACEGELGSANNQFYYQMWQQAVMQGISVFIASGDQGSAACDNGTNNQAAISAQSGLQVSGFASTPFNVAVGGTDFNDINSSGTVLTQFWGPNNPTTQTSALSYIPEVVWNNSCSSNLWAVIGASTDPLANCNNTGLNGQGVVGGGGGASGCTAGNPVDAAACLGGYPKPYWQAGSGVPNDGKRDIPDISAFSGSGFFNKSFYIVCQMDANTGAGSSTGSCNLTTPFLDFQGFGGTSVATPAMAGVMALVVQQTGEKQGNPNPVHYTLATQDNIFHAITGTNAMPCTPATVDCTDAAGGDAFGLTTVQTGPLAGSLGYSSSSSFNLAAGLGSANVANFVTGFASAVLSPDFMTCVAACPQTGTPTTLTVPAGGNQSTTITLQGVTAAYTGMVTLSCSGLPTGTTCAFTPTTPVQVTGTTAVSVPLMLTNTASGMLSPMGHRIAPPAQVGSGRLMLLFVCFAIMWLGIQAGRRRLRWSVVASLLLVGCVVGIAACGGGGGGTTPPINPTVANQTVVVIATDGTKTHSTYFLLTVQ